MKIGWQVGPHEWAFKALTSHLIKALPDFEHVINEPGDVNIVLAVVHLKQYDNFENIIIHIDGNRWYKRGDFKPRV
jgi:hypothetical protein